MAGWSPWGRKELDMTEWLTHMSSAVGCLPHTEDLRATSLHLWAQFLLLPLLSGLWSCPVLAPPAELLTGSDDLPPADSPRALCHDRSLSNPCCQCHGHQASKATKTVTIRFSFCALRFSKDHPVFLWCFKIKEVSLPYYLKGRHVSCNWESLDCFIPHPILPKIPLCVC